MRRENAAVTSILRSCPQTSADSAMGHSPAVASLTFLPQRIPARNAVVLCAHSRHVRTRASPDTLKEVKTGEASE
jgi:hypothetical protein